MAEVPLGNLYRLLIYACELAPKALIGDAGVERAKGADDLIGKLLVSHADIIDRQAAAGMFEEELIELDAPVGRIDFAASICSGSVARGRLTCAVDNLAFRSPIAPLLRRAASLLLRRADVSRETRLRLVALRSRIPPSGQHLEVAAVRRLPGVSRCAGCRGVLNLCDLLFRQYFLSNTASERTSVIFDLDAIKRHRLFEAFVRGYIKAHSSPGWRVGRRQVAWSNRDGDPAGLSKLPGMELDVVVEYEKSALIVDAKCYSQPLVAVDGKVMFRSDHLYQVYAYSQNWRLLNPDTRVTALLLYAHAGTEFDHLITYAGQQLRLATVDLCAPWPAVESRMATILDFAGRLSDRQV